MPVPTPSELMHAAKQTGAEDALFLAWLVRTGRVYLYQHGCECGRCQRILGRFLAEVVLCGLDGDSI